LSLIRELEADARQTHTTLATKLGVNRATVTSRLKRLVDGHVIEPVCYVDPRLGYALRVNLGITTQPGQSNDVAKKLAGHAAVNAVMVCAGGFDIVAYAVLRDQDELLHLLTVEISGIQGIQRVEPLLILKSVKMPVGLFSDNRAYRPSSRPLDTLDATDLALIKQLQMDAMKGMRDIAKELNISPSTASRRIASLLNSGVIRFAITADPLALGYKGAAFIYLKIEPEKLNAAAEGLGSYANVFYVGIISGRFNAVAWVLFRELNELNHLLTAELNTLPGLRDTEAMLCLKTLKRSYYVVRD